jgi:uncharacterized protein DUF1302
MALTSAKGDRTAGDCARIASVSLVTLLCALAVSGSARADWWSENVEIHGSFSSTVYFNAPSLTNDLQMDQWWNQLELDGDFKLINGEDNALSFHTIILPTYDAAYDLYPKLLGDKREAASFGTQTATNAELAMRGKSFKGHGACIDGAFCDVNQDTAFIFTGKNNPAMVVDNTIFFGILVTQTRARSASGQTKLGGGPSMDAYQQAVRCFTVSTLPDCQLIRSAAGFDRSNFLATVANGQADRGNFTPIHSFGNHGQYVIGDRHSAERQLPAGINLTDGQLKTHCFDVAHPYCWAREFYFEAKFLGDNQIRIGRQQIVWGKTDAFRLQDIVNPIDFSYHNVYPSLEDRRIPVLAADLVHSFGNLGPLEDVSLELVWVFDRFTPVYVGQCGDFWAFTAACEARIDAGSGGLLNLSLAKSEERKWTIHNTEPGFRFEFRTPEPSIAFSLSGFWGMQDAPVARFENHYSVKNPNPAMILFLQALGVGDIPTLPGILPSINAFDVAPGGSVDTSSQTALATWGALFGPAGALCPDTPGNRNVGKAKCIAASGLQALGWIWSSSQAVTEYPRTFTLGGSMDYQIPNIDTVLRFEAAYDFNREIQDTNRLDGIGHSDVVLGAIGLDRSFFIPFLNKDRTAFLSFQTFMQHIMNFDGNQKRGMADYEYSVISTFFMENYWRGDSIVLTNFFAYDWAAHAWITGPKLKWIMNESIYFEAGINLIQGQGHEHNIRDICKDGSFSCLGDPTTWQTGNWQLINKNFDRYAESPFWNMESFADMQMKKRDEVWFSATYQF